MGLNKENNVATKIKLIIKWILTILLLLIGLSFIAQKNINEKIGGIILILLGCMACPKINEYIQSNNKFSIYNKYKKLLTWIFVIIFFVLIGISGSNNQNYYNNQINDISMSANESQDEIEIADLKFNENEIELDIRETKDILLEILPQNANANSLEFCSSDNNIAILEKVSMEGTENKITLRIKPISEGECEVYAKNNKLISNKIKIRIIDKERIKKEEEEQKAKQEKESQELETKQEKETQEQSKTTMEAQNNNSNSQANVKSQKNKTNFKSNSNNSHGKVVYRTPTGKRYHFDPNCGGKNSYQTTLEDAKMDGLTPCKKCAK